jgi:hypothetical protein
MEIKYILTDFDGTLTVNGMINMMVYETLWWLYNNGKIIIIVTGRPSSWGNMMIHTWPVHAVICENGGVYYYKKDNEIIYHKVAKTLEKDKLIASISKKFPTLTLSDDQHCRESDVAIVINEEYYRHEKEVLEFIKKYQYKISNIHLNVWFDQYDKKTTALNLIKLLNPPENYLDHSIYIGDSPNDVPMFKHFPRSIGVRNILEFKNLEKYPPIVTSRKEGEGFVDAISYIFSNFKIRSEYEKMDPLIS